MTEKEEEIEKKESKSEDKKEEIKEESGLEEDIELAETNIDENKFQEFVRPNSSKISVALDQIAEIPEQLTSLEMGVSQAPRTKEGEKKDELYGAGYKEKEEEKSYTENQKTQIESNSFMQTPQELQGEKDPKKDYVEFKTSGEDFTKRTTHDPFQQ